MALFAERQFQLSRIGKDGVSFGDKMQHVARSTGKTPAILKDQPQLPMAAEHVWGWFCELSAGRGGNGFGPNPISWPDLQAWCAVTGRTLRAWEVRILRRLDSLYLKSHAESAP